jgi:hypothetical protein
VGYGGQQGQKALATTLWIRRDWCSKGKVHSAKVRDQDGSMCWLKGVRDGLARLSFA